MAFTTNIEIAVYGIRNLVRAAKKPIITIRLTNDPEKRKLKLNTAGDGPINTKNPNFGETIVFKNVKLTFEPLLWP
jgi:hypothetical protein